MCSPPRVSSCVVRHVSRVPCAGGAGGGPAVPPGGGVGAGGGVRHGGEDGDQVRGHVAQLLLRHRGHIIVPLIPRLKFRWSVFIAPLILVKCELIKVWKVVLTDGPDKSPLNTNSN